jgi:ABC-type sugar transport system substrate-binding protein
LAGEQIDAGQQADRAVALVLVVALGPALQEAITAKIPIVTIDRRARVPGILAHVSADNAAGGEAQGKLVMKLFANGARIMYLEGQPGATPAIERSEGLHNVLDKAPEKYKFVFEDTALFDRAKGLAMTESALAGMKTPPDVIVCANDDMALGALVALKSRNLIRNVAVIGFDALPEALEQIKSGNLTATIEQKPGGQSSRSVDILVTFLRDGVKPKEQVTQLAPVIITKDNVEEAERIGEVK